MNILMKTNVSCLCAGQYENLWINLCVLCGSAVNVN